MLRCATCNLTYPDDALAFCTEDGTRLVPDAQASNPQPPTQVLPYDNALQAPPAPQQYAPQPQPAHQQQWAQPQARSGGGTKVMIGVLIGLLVAGGAGVGIYFLTKGSSSPSTGSTNDTTLPTNSRSSSANSSSSPGASSSSPTSNPSTPTEVWKAFYAAVKKRDVAAMKKLMSNNTLDWRKERTDEGFAGWWESYIGDFTSETRNEKITGDNATVGIIGTNGPWIGRFVKENGLWKFDGSTHADSPLMQN